MVNEFDEKAKDWDSDPNKISRARTVAEAIRNRVTLGPHMEALEYGCGTGLLSFALQPYLGHITLADSSEGMLAALRGKIASSGVGNMTPIKLDLSVDSMPARGFDLICTLMTLHHIPDTDGILRGFHRLLRPGGHLCVADLDTEDGSFHGAGFTGHRGFDRGELGERARRAGLDEASFETVFRVAKDAGGSTREYPVFLMIARKP